MRKPTGRAGRSKKFAPADLPPFFTTTSRLHTRHPTNIHERILNLFFLNTQRARIINLSSHRIPRVYMSAIHQHLYLFTTSRHAIPPATSVLASRVEGEFVLYVSKARGSCYVDRGVLARDDESSSGEQDVCMGGLRLAYADHRSTQPSAAPSRCLPTFALRCRIKFDGFVVGRWVVHCEEGVSLPRRHVSTSGEQGCGVVEVATLRTCSKSVLENDVHYSGDNSSLCATRMCRSESRGGMILEMDGRASTRIETRNNLPSTETALFRLFRCHDDWNSGEQGRDDGSFTKNAPPTQKLFLGDEFYSATTYRRPASTA